MSDKFMTPLASHDMDGAQIQWMIRGTGVTRDVAQCENRSARGRVPNFGGVGGLA